MSETTVTPPGSPSDLERGGAAGRASDKIFGGLTLAAGVLIFVVLALVTLYLVLESLPAMTAAPSQISVGTSFWAYVGPLVVGTLIAALIALLVATPVAVGVALFISHYAPARFSKGVGYVVDLLAAIPSVVYGAWGFTVFGPALVPGYHWLNKYLGFIPVFGTPSTTGRTLLTAALVLAVMILPIITSQCREIFIQTPSLHQEAALALGATKWDMIRAAVFPFARNGIVSAIMLGLGRALGETMAVTLVLSRGGLTPNLIGVGNNTIPAEIALNFPEAFGMRQSELIAAGLVLFIITLVVNMMARWIVSRYAEFSGAN
ncbi:phosphate ABC transporter permease subunit PstC [Raineyella fluvialis]|uniref:Phosphate transport system permease protein n=1 Tax=Raineyella fluvialis TaxID=2662261 RepID=A0A5Q2FB72_9ACTN|nr:phosphate ABC transporter permease subunit PstC [Raineyella fluvialis]QGF23968.1 phosphate ABC transporter permease subunit PstC [Raineyella fluvialis]